MSQRLNFQTLKTGHEKINMLLSIKNELPEKKSSLTEAARNFVVNQLNSIVDCFSNHFNEKQDEFVAKRRNFAVSKFQKDNCTGEGSTCSKKSKQ